MSPEVKPSMMVVAGPNGAGKTTITQKLLSHDWIQDAVYINPDNIANEEFGGWNSPEAIVKAANKAEQIRKNCLELRKSFAFETVFSSPEKIEFLEEARQLGFFIRFFFIGTNHPSINAARIAKRMMDGGHEVPISKIVSRHPKSICNAGLVSEWVDRAYIYDNSIDAKDPRLLFRTEKGKISKVYGEIASWAQPIFSKLQSSRE